MLKKFIHKDKRGFTLVELLVIIAIIGILVALAMEPGQIGRFPFFPVM